MCNTAFRCNPSQSVPDSSAQCFHTGEHYIRLQTGFRAKHNVIRYFTHLLNTNHKEPIAFICPPSMLSPVTFRTVCHTSI